MIPLTTISVIATHWFMLFFKFIIVCSEAVPLRRETRTKFFRDEGQRGGVLLPGNLNKKLNEIRTK